MSLKRSLASKPRSRKFVTSSVHNVLQLISLPFIPVITEPVAESGPAGVWLPYI